MQELPDSDFERWAREHNQGNLNSPTTRQLYENRLLTVEEYISQFRRATIKAVLPTEAKTMTVEDALKVGKIGTINVRKLLTDNRDKFQK
ncbi:hypothetical protein [Scytonema sp. NUACC26]|uniref:hypothetical protein n=1 Tax=Scytonema sp. NUACC26 TaxID=3140176 RepID=UPI0034DC14CB